MTLDEVEELYRSWKRSPPTSVLMARFVGFQPPEEIDEKPSDPAQWEQAERWLQDRVAAVAEGRG